MGDIFAKDWQGAPFELFGTGHLIALGVIALAIAALLYFGKRASPRARTAIRWGLAILLTTAESSWHIWRIAVGTWTVQEMLPLHLCSVMLWLTVIMLLTKNYRIYEFAYLLGMAGALQALLTPEAGIYGFPHFRIFQTLIAHSIIVAAALYMTIVEGYRPTPQSLKRVIIYSNLYAVVIFFFNFLIGSNYLFIAHKPPTASIIDMMPAWPWYLPFIELIGLIFMALFYAPFAVIDWRAKRLNG